MVSSEYRTLSREIELLVVAHPAWSPSEIRRMTVKERRHWMALALHDNDVREAANNG